MTSTTEFISVADIEVPKDRVRNVTEERVLELADSIASEGLLHPILVRQMCNGKFRLIAGAHRLAALRRLGEELIWTTVRPADESKAAADADMKGEIDENVVASRLSAGERNLQLRMKWLIWRREYEGKGDLPKFAAGKATQRLAKSQSVKRRRAEYILREAEQLERLADFAGCDLKQLAKFDKLSARRQLQAAIEIIDTYGKGTVIEAGNVHALLKSHIRRAAKGETIDLVEYRRAVDTELRRDELASKRSADEGAYDQHIAQLASRAARSLKELTEAMAKGGSGKFMTAGKKQKEARIREHWDGRIKELERLAGERRNRGTSVKPVAKPVHVVKPRRRSSTSLGSSARH